MNGFANAAYYFFAMGMALLLIDNIRKRPNNPSARNSFRDTVG